MTYTLHQKVAVITGAGSGIGLATADALYREGAHVVVAGRSERRLHDAVDNIRSHHPNQDNQIVSVPTDVSAERDVIRLFDTAYASFGAVDIVVNNAAVFVSGEIDELSVGDWDHIMAVNVRGVFLCCRMAFKYMKQGGGGSIVNVSSLAGIRGTQKFSGFTAYTASKHAVIGITENTAEEGRPHHIRVNCVAPGAVNTDMLRKAAPGLTAEAVPDDIASSIMYLCDPVRSPFVTGAVVEIHCNGR